MPSTEGLEVLVRKVPLTDEEWLGLVAARRELIKPHLDSLTLPELGSLSCMRSETNFTHELRWDALTLLGDERFSLKTQGIFRVQPWSVVEKIPNSGFRPEPGCTPCPDGMKQVWGLTRSGLWVLAAISFVDQAGYKGRGYERARTIEIQEVDLPTIVAKTKEKPQRMWEELGKAIRGFADHREWLYEQARNLARMVAVEELALSLVPRGE